MFSWSAFSTVNQQFFIKLFPRVDSRGRFKSTPLLRSGQTLAGTNPIDTSKKKSRRRGETLVQPDKSGKKRDTESQLREIGSKVRGWRNYHRFCDMGKHSLWFVNHWLWKKLRKDKARTKEKEIGKLLSKKKAGSIANIKASELESKRKETPNASQTPKACLPAQARRSAGVWPDLSRGAAKRILNNAQIKIAFPPVERKVNSHVMVKGAASPFDGNMVYWVKRKSKIYSGQTAKAMTRQKMRCKHCNMSFFSEDIVELHHVDGNHNNWKPRNVVALHRECHQHQEVQKDRIKAGKRDGAA